MNAEDVLTATALVLFGFAQFLEWSRTGGTGSLIFGLILVLLALAGLLLAMRPGA